MKPNEFDILVVDDEPNIRKLLHGVLTDEGYRVSSAGQIRAARQMLQEHAVDLVLLDVCLPGENGLDLLREISGGGEGPPVIMMSGHANIRTALDAIALGAVDFIEKPLSAERLLISIANCLDRQRLKNENRRLRSQNRRPMEILGEDEVMQNLREEIGRAGPTDARVLITGENGTGKELVAHAIVESSTRRNRPFIQINCAAIPSELLESELFGHEKGAFTGAVATRKGKFEAAQHGTLLLDEVGDMNPTTQAKLLRVLEEEVIERVGGQQRIPLDVRVISATNQDLEKLVQEGCFRKDLYYRLKVIPIHCPPLRDHPEDIPSLCDHFIHHFCSEHGKSLKSLEKGIEELLRACSWPGNVRELRNLVERWIIMTSGEKISLEQVRRWLASESESAGEMESFPHEPGQDLSENLQKYEEWMIRRALAAAGGNLAEAARELGIDRANLHRKMKRLQIERP